MSIRLAETPRRNFLAACFAAGVAGVVAMDAGAQPSQAADLRVEDLGDDRFRVSQIVVDKAAGSFSVPAKLLDLGMPDAPLEFLVATRNGPKAYETMFEIEAKAHEFNLACILIGLDEGNATPPVGRFDPTPADGDPVELTIGWDADGVATTRPITAFLEVRGSREATDEWVYIGSFFLPDGTYAADPIGLAAGFSHDPESIIQHASGLGIEGYGAVTPRSVEGVGPETPLTLTVTRITD